MMRRLRDLVLSLGARIFFGYFLVLGVVAYAALSYFSDAIKPAVRQTMEEAMVEEVALLASVIEANFPTTDAREGLLAPGFDTMFRSLSQRELLALIHGVGKHRWEQRVYVTDNVGNVVFDSTQRDVGADYSRWNNVRLTLLGKYGARSTHEPRPTAPSVMHVSAPIRRDRAIVGVVTVAKRVADGDPFLDLALTKLRRTGAVALLLSLGVGLGMSFLLSRSVSHLVAYAKRVTAGHRTVVPHLTGELGVLADAMNQMKIGLEGKAYVEQAMQTFAHEMKSPLSGIIASAELLEGELSNEDRSRFASHVQIEARRMQHLLERLLELAVLEQRQTLRDAKELSVDELVLAARSTLSSALSKKGLTVGFEAQTKALVWGESVLLVQALRNLIDNASDFAMPDTVIRIIATRTENAVVIRIHNVGPAIPDYAKGRIFERFYSLPRPGSGRRSQGLGLAFVREVTDLHGGTVEIANAADGVDAIVTLPLRAKFDKNS